PSLLLLFFLFTPPVTSYSSSLSLHDALPISKLFLNVRRYHDITKGFTHLTSFTIQNKSMSEHTLIRGFTRVCSLMDLFWMVKDRSEEHTSELQSRFDLVCRLLLEKKKKNRLL